MALIAKIPTAVHSLPNELLFSLILPRIPHFRSRTYTTSAETAKTDEKPLKRRPGSFKPPALMQWTDTVKFQDMILNSPYAPIETLTRELEKRSNILNGTVVCLQLCRELKKRYVAENKKPTYSVYYALLKSLAGSGLHEECRLAIDDLKAMGGKPDVTCYNAWLRACMSRGVDISPVLTAMQDEGVEYNVGTYRQLLYHYCRKRNLEHALLLLFQAHNDNLKLSADCFDQVINLAAGFCQQPRLAHELCMMVQRETDWMLSLPTMQRVLETCARLRYTAGLIDLYPSLVDTHKITLDNSVLEHILDHAASIGSSSIVHTALGHLRAKKAIIQTHHMNRLVEAYCRDDEFKKAVATVAFMQENQITPDEATGRPITNCILLRYEKDQSSATPITEEQQLDSLDKAYEHITTLFASDPTKVDQVIMNALIAASVQLNDLHRALTTYKDFSSSIKPNIHIYNSLLEGCIRLRLRSLGDSLLTELKNQNLKPDKKTYELLIRLCVVSNSGEWRDALGYLSALKNYGIVPDIEVYVSVGYRMGWEENEGLFDLLQEVLDVYGRNGENKVKRAANLGRRDREDQELDVTGMKRK